MFLSYFLRLCASIFEGDLKEIGGESPVAPCILTHDLKYSMKYANLMCEALKTQEICFECSICIKFLQYVTKAMFVIVL